MLELSLPNRFHTFGPESQVTRSKYTAFEGKPISYARNEGSEYVHMGPLSDYSVMALHSKDQLLVT